MSSALSHFTAKKQFRYIFREGNSFSAKKKLLIALHGYGQLIHYFSKKFEGMEEHSSLLFPEGMHRFYLNGTSGRVGASWMTKEDRLVDIEDNLHWLTALLEEISQHQYFEEVALLGFSQGGATAARWYCSQKDKFNSLIMWASLFPGDIAEMNVEVTNGTFIVGTKDPYFQAEMKNTLHTYESLNYNVIKFDGVHDIHLPTLISLYHDK